MIKDSNRYENVDIALVGAGIMSATLGLLLKQLQPQLNIKVFERLDYAAAESSDAWNNAGTGHSAFCELNYTPYINGKINIDKAVNVASSFEVSKQFWAYLIEHKLIDKPDFFIHQIPHISFVSGKEDVLFLKKRHEALIKSALFEGMQFTTDFSVLEEWVPLLMEGRKNIQNLAATKMNLGTDVNFGSLTRCMFKALEKQNVCVSFNYEVLDLKKIKGKWQLKIKECKTRRIIYLQSDFVFIGAGGGSLPLLLKSKIEEGKNYGGFPVSGKWLICNNEKVINRHNAKVYGKASVGSPPMSVPHLDTRFIKGKQQLLFGPFACFTTRFLKKGSFLDFFKSLRFTNLIPIISAGLHNIPLTKYLISQVSLSQDERMDGLRQFMPAAEDKDWELAVAGQRVQVIKKDEKEGGILEFGTEVVSAADGSLAALLGASPGASTAVSIMLDVLKKCFSQKFNSPVWQNKLREMIPSFGKSLAEDALMLQTIRKHTSAVLKIKPFTNQ